MRPLHDEPIAGGEDWKAYKAAFDRCAKDASCLRCGAKGSHGFSRSVSTPKGVLQLSCWLCPACNQALHEFLNKFRTARRAEMASSIEARRASIAADRNKAAGGGSRKPPARSPGPKPSKS